MASPPEVDTLAVSGAPPAGPAHVSWWLRPFLGRDARLEPAALRVLGLVAIGMFFETYDIGLVNAALPQIAADLDIATGDTGFYLSAIRLGGLGTFLIVPFADRIGRRRVFLASLLGMSIGTLATGLAQSAVQFALAQIVTRAFLLTASALALVILVEEFPAEHRGAGIGLLSVLGGLGFGLGAGLYAAVDLLPFGWRALYAIGLLPVFLIPFMRRSLQETARFENHRLAREPAQQADGWHGWIEPVLHLARARPGRTLTVGAAGLLGAMGSIGFFQYTSYFVQSVHGWAPGHYALLVFGGGLIGLGGNILGGRGSDRFGRRRVGFSCLVLAPLFVASFYHGPEATLAPAWGLAVLCHAAGEVIVRALAAEIFPTSHRGAASGWLIAVQTLGWTLGLFVVGLGTESMQDLARIVTVLALASVAAAICVSLLPETGRRELEAIAEEAA
jgi:MFS family permease